MYLELLLIHILVGIVLLNNPFLMTTFPKTYWALESTNVLKKMSWSWERHYFSAPTIKQSRIQKKLTKGYETRCLLLLHCSQSYDLLALDGYSSFYYVIYLLPLPQFPQLMHPSHLSLQYAGLCCSFKLRNRIAFPPQQWNIFLEARSSCCSNLQQPAVSSYWRWTI